MTQGCWNIYYIRVKKKLSEVFSNGFHCWFHWGSYIDKKNYFVTHAINKGIMHLMICSSPSTIRGVNIVSDKSNRVNRELDELLFVNYI